MAKIAVVSMVKNEADVIESFVRHALTFAEVLLVADHRSTDGTADILAKLAAEGLPVVLERLSMVEQAQAEVVTSLMRRAFCEWQADFVLPLDADEFLLADDGQLDLRAAFGRLDTSRVYSLAWIRYALAAPEQGKAQFLLARPCVREAQAETLRKVLIGREAAAVTQLTVSQGSHVAVVAGEAGPLALVAEPLMGMHLAHFPWRSAAQAASKAACGWLANVAKYSRATDIANHWRRDFRALLAGQPLTAPLLTAPVRTALPPSARGVRLRYTPAAAGDALANVLRLGEALADSYAALAIQQRRQRVSFLLPCFGDLADLRQHLAGVQAQTYPYRDVFVLLLGGELPFEAAAALIEEFDGGQLLDGRQDMAGMFTHLAEIAAGAYVQWLFPGDRLRPEKVQRMLVSLETQPELTFVLSNAVLTPPVAEALQAEKDLPADEETAFVKGDGTEVWQYLLRTGGLPSGGISSVLFRRETMLRTGWLQSVFTGGRPLYMSMWGKVLPGSILGVFGERLLDSPGTVLAADDFIWQQLEWYCLLEEYAATAAYREGRQAMQARFRQAAALAGQFSSPLYAKYRELLLK